MMTSLYSEPIHVRGLKRATLLLDRLRDFVVVPSSAGGNSPFELNSQSTEERATLLPWSLGHMRLISFLGLVCAALLFFSTY